jgi:hypothetical protein
MPAAWRRRNDRQVVGARRGRWVDAVGAQDSADRAGRHLAAQAQQLAADPLVAPPRILAGKSHDQLLYLVGHRRSSHGHGRVGPPPTDHTPMPAQQGLGPHQELRPASPRELTAQCREQGTIVRLQPWPWMLPAQHRKLVAQHQDLDLLGLGRPAAEHDQLKDVAQRQVDERPDHKTLRDEGKPSDDIP